MLRIKRKIACILVIIIAVTTIISQGTVSAYHPRFQINQSIGTQLWRLTRHDLYPDRVATTGQTTLVRAIWLGTDDGGNGTDWTLVRRNPPNNAQIALYMDDFTHMAIFFVHRRGTTVTHRVDGNVLSWPSTVGVSEVYNASGARIVGTGMIEFWGNNIVVPIAGATSTTYRLDAGLQTFTITVNWQ